MNRLLPILLITTISVHAQVSTYDHIYFCDKILANANNSVSHLHTLYTDLLKYKKSSSNTLRYFASYDGAQQPDEQLYAKIKTSAPSFYKTTNTQLWKLYTDFYNKNEEIVVYLRLQDYKTDLDKGFALIREMQQLQAAMGKTRDQLANKIAQDASALPATNTFTAAYQLMMKAVLHEEVLIRQLAENFNNEVFIGFPKEEIIKSFLETDDLLKTLRANPQSKSGYFKSCVEGLQLTQQTKQHALDDFNNTSTLDGEHLNQLYGNLQNYFNNDLLHFYANFCAQASLPYYPIALRQFDIDSTQKPWPLTRLTHSLTAPDSVVVSKQASPLPVAGFTQLNNMVQYIDECVRTMTNLFKTLDREESTWRDLHKGKMPYRDPIIKFDKFTVPVTLHALLIKESKNLPAPYRASLVHQVNDLQQIMLSLQDHAIDLSQYMSQGRFRGAGMDFIETKLSTMETLYTELDKRKESLFLQIRQVYTSFPPRKTNAWTVSAGALLKATDDSRKTLQQVEARVYEQNETPLIITHLREDQRDLIINQAKYMNGIVRIGTNNGLCPYRPYEYIPGYLKTLEEKVAAFPPTIENKNKTYGDILYMHNITVEQYNKFAELALGENEYAVNDPMRPVYLLSYIRQPPKYHHELPKPEEKKPDLPIDPSPVIEIAPEPISFEGYAYNNLVLLLDVSASMNKPDRLPLLKKSLLQLIPLMRHEDEVSIVIYSGKASLHLPPSPATDTTKIIQAIQTVRSAGNTNSLEGLTLAYKTANKNFMEGGNNKIIMATDGEFPTTEPITKLIIKNASKIALSIFDFSQLPKPLEALKLLTEKGSGNYVKVNTENSLQELANETRKKSE